MDFEIPEKKESSPFLQLVLLVAYAILGAIICTVLCLIILVIIYGFPLFKDFNSLIAGDPRYLNGLKILQIGSTIGMFLLPPIILAYTEHRKPKHFFGLYQPQAMLLLLVLAIMFISMPLMEWGAVWNQKMVLPEFLKGVEQWMKEKEDAAAKLTLELITVKNPWDFGVNLLMIAILPAIGEELMFRGGLQRIIKRMFGNPHLAIWLTAVIFSAIHMQFYGFVPRLLLGAGFGYLYFYSGNLWYAIFGHFLNNGFAVCVAYYMQHQGLPIDNADQPIGFGWYFYFLSAIFTIALFIYFKKNTSSGRKLG
ncbi:membrane protease YdiL (CAAX protease family) [Pedobacter sp. UYEF25]